jgi:hypothetical protein
MMPALRAEYIFPGFSWSKYGLANFRWNLNSFLVLEIASLIISTSSGYFLWHLLDHYLGLQILPATCRFIRFEQPLIEKNGDPARSIFQISIADSCQKIAFLSPFCAFEYY